MRKSLNILNPQLALQAAKKDKMAQSSYVFNPSRSSSPDLATKNTDGRGYKSLTGPYFPGANDPSFPHCTHSYNSMARPIPRQDSKCTVSRNFVPDAVYQQWKREAQTNNQMLSPIMKSKKDKLQMASKMVDKECKQFMREMTSQMDLVVEEDWINI